MKLEINSREFWTAVACHRFESGDMSPHSKWAFTLIELLVVITIIVVLLSLLAPALDKAIYQAELTACGARLHAHGLAVTSYAMDSKRYYPYRAGVMDANASFIGAGGVNPAFLPFYLALTGAGNSGTHDDRPELRPYMAINKFMACPFVKELDFDHAENYATGAKSVILYTSYTYYYGFQFAGDPGMIKLGDRLKWTYRNTGDNVQRSYNVLVCDTDTADVSSGPWVLDAHPETRDPILTLETEYGTNLNPFVQSYQWWSYWETHSRTDRGPVDRNFAFGDGSVGRIYDLALDKNEFTDTSLERADNRVDIVAAYTPQSAGEVYQYHTWLPRD